MPGVRTLFLWCRTLLEKRDVFISDVHLWPPSHSRAKAGRPARAYIQQICEDTGCSPEDLPEAIYDREEWRERVRYIPAGGMMRMRASTTKILQNFVSPSYFAKLALTTKILQKLCLILVFTHGWGKNKWIHIFPKDISVNWNSDRLSQDLNSVRWFDYLC